MLLIVQSLLAKVSAECLDLVDYRALSVRGTSDMFGKKFKKAVLKDLKLAKEMDNLVGAMTTVKTNRLSLFASSPGKARATIPGHGASRAGINALNPEQISGRIFPAQKENPITFQARKSKISRYCSNSSDKNSNFKPNRSETGSTCSHFDFQSFKSRFCSPVVNPALLAGRLGHFLPNWRRITNDPTVLETIQGYKLKFISTLVQSTVRHPLQFSCSEKIDALLEKEALHVVKPVSDQFISNLFLVLKRDGKSRPVINLKDLNTFLQYDHFKMEGIHLLRDLLQPHDWLGKIDLKDAYFVIPIWKNHRKYLRLLWKNTLLEFACLPFGLAVAPRLFTKVMKPVVALLRRAGIRLIIYLDDLLFMNQSQVGLEQDMVTARYLLENLGFVVNFEKSCFVATQQLEFLGFLVNSRDMTLLLPDCKVEAGNKSPLHCLCLLARQDVSVRELFQLIRKLTASTPRGNTISSSVQFGSGPMGVGSQSE